MRKMKQERKLEFMFRLFFCYDLAMKNRAIICLLALASFACTLLIPRHGLCSPSLAKPISEEFLTRMEKAHFQYFRKYSDAKSGLTMDSSRPKDPMVSIAAVGFSLSAHLIAAQRSYITRAEAQKYVLKTLRTLWSLPQGKEEKGVSGYRGFFYHFLEPKSWTRKGAWVELSSIDTALLMSGVLSCQTYFTDKSAESQEIRQLAKKLFERVEWDWMFQESGYISMGWLPEPGKGFLKSQWSMFCEGPILILLAAGSPTHPVPKEAWPNYLKNYKSDKSYGKERICFAPTYGFQYPQCWIDFRGLQDAATKKWGFDYFENAKRILEAQYNYCLANPMGWRSYGKDCWGLTACDGPGSDKKTYNGKKVEFRGYSARGCPNDFDDGTIAPTAVAASVPFAPELTIATMKAWREQRPEIWGDCGFKDAFNPSYEPEKPSGWVDEAYLGIDQGPIVIMIENYRSALIWDLMKKNDVIRRGLIRSGFSGGWLGETSLQNQK